MSKHLETTLAILKPDSVNRHLIGEIISRFEKAGLYVKALQMVHMSAKQAGEFYAIHKAMPFYGELVEYMSSAPVVVIALQGPDAVAKNRQILGATNPADAACGTIRHDFGLSIGENSVHGSDSVDNAKTELNFFFDQDFS